MTVVVIARDPLRRRALIQEAESAGWTVRADVPAEASLSAEDLDGVAALIVDLHDARVDDHGGDDEAPLLEPLTAREQDVLECAAAGLHAKEIASRLGISPRTVEVHKTRIMTKLEVRNMAELVRFAIVAKQTRS